MLKKIWSANDNRKSRFHDRHGQMAPLGRIFKNFPRALTSAIWNNLTGGRAALPWISYDAADLLKEMLTERPCDVLEFGSGMSTLWFAHRTRRLCSIEHDPLWYAEVKRRLGLKRPSARIEYLLAEDSATYSSFKASSHERFDLILVDGPWRADCLLKHMHLIKKGGIIYLDNTDAESSSGEPGEIDLATQRLQQFIKEKQGTMERFTDFAPGCVFASEGYLARIPTE